MGDLRYAVAVVSDSGGCEISGVPDSGEILI